MRLAAMDLGGSAWSPMREKLLLLLYISVFSPCYIHLICTYPVQDILGGRGRWFAGVETNLIFCTRFRSRWIIVARILVEAAARLGKGSLSGMRWSCNVCSLASTRCPGVSNVHPY